MKLIIPIILALLGTGAGVGAAIVMGADKQSHVTEIACLPAAENIVAETPPSSEEAPPSDGEFVKLANQFLVPVLAQDEVDAMVVMSLSLEVEPGTTSEVFHLEPKIRDKFLQSKGKKIKTPQRSAKRRYSCGVDKNKCRIKFLICQ